jgi:acyl carrier protein
VTELYPIIERYLVDEFGVDPDDVRADSTLQGMELDSLSLAELSVILEEHLGVSLDGVDLNSTLSDTVQYIASKVDSTVDSTVEPAR